MDDGDDGGEQLHEDDPGVGVLQPVDVDVLLLGLKKVFKNLTKIIKHLCKLYLKRKLQPDQKFSVTAGNSYRRGRLSAVALIVLTGFDQLLLMMQT